MSRFLAGFLIGSLVAVGAAFGARALGLLTLEWGPPQVATAAPDGDLQASKREPDPAKRKRKPVRPHSARSHQPGNAEAQSGDDLGAGEARELDLAQGGGEEQLLPREVEQAFDQNFAQVRRCLVLVDTDAPVRGTVKFGLRISGRQGVTRVNLTGPSAVTTGEAGDCLRKAARGLKLRSFNGPDMVVHYPVVLSPG